jgi:hypothetical protein
MMGLLKMPSLATVLDALTSYSAAEPYFSNVKQAK